MNEYQELIDLLNSKRFHAEFFEDTGSAKKRIMELISDADSIGIGGSQTIKESGLFDEIAATGKTIYSQTLERKKEKPDNMAVWRSAMGADVYLTSTNALTREGDLIHIDGNGKMCIRDSCTILLRSSVPITALAPSISIIPSLSR